MPKIKYLQKRLNFVIYGSNSNRKSKLSELLTEPLNQRDVRSLFDFSPQSYNVL